MSKRIVLFGATGYTGRLVAERLAAQGARPVLAGRDERRLGELAERLGGLETVRGRKSTSRRLPAVAVLRTTVSPALTTTAPEACLAIHPVSNEISVPPISTLTRVTSDICSFPSRQSVAGPLRLLCRFGSCSEAW